MSVDTEKLRALAVWLRTAREDADRVDSAADEIDELRDKQPHWTAKVEELIGHHERLRATLGEEHAAHEATKLSLSQMDAINAKLSDDLQRACLELASLKDGHEATKRELDEFRAALEHEVQAHVTVDRELAELRKENDSCHDALDLAAERYDTELKAVARMLTDERAAHEATKQKVRLAQERNRSSHLESSALFSRLQDERAAHEATKRELAETRERLQAAETVMRKAEHTGLDGNCEDGCAWCLAMGKDAQWTTEELVAGKHDAHCPIGDYFARYGARNLQTEMVLCTPETCPGDAEGGHD